MTPDNKTMLTNYTAADVPDQSGKTFFITGANTGIGFEVDHLLLHTVEIEPRDVGRVGERERDGREQEVPPAPPARHGKPAEPEPEDDDQPGPRLRTGALEAQQGRLVGQGGIARTVQDGEEVAGEGLHIGRHVRIADGLFQLLAKTGFDLRQLRAEFRGDLVRRGRGVLGNDDHRHVLAEFHAGAYGDLPALAAGFFVFGHCLAAGVRGGSGDDVGEQADSIRLLEPTEFAEFVDDTGYVTVAEQPPDPALYPGAPAENLVPGGLVFTMTPTPVRLNDYSQWWRWTPGASWRHPLPLAT